MLRAMLNAQETAQIPSMKMKWQATSRQKTNHQKNSFGAQPKKPAPTQKADKGINEESWTFAATKQHIVAQQEKSTTGKLGRRVANAEEKA